MNDKILRIINSLGTHYYRLLIIVGSNDKQINRVVKSLHEELNISEVNLNLMLSEKLLEIQKTSHSISIPHIINQIIQNKHQESLIIKNIELLFEPSLQQNPLELLKQVSRKTTIITFWTGTIFNNKLTYAEPGHPEYRIYDITGINVFQIVNEKIIDISGGCK